MAYHRHPGQLLQCTTVVSVVRVTNLLRQGRRSNLRLRLRCNQAQNLQVWEGYIPVFGPSF